MLVDADILFQGYELSDEEVNVSLEDFGLKFTDGGIPRYESHDS